MPCLEEALKFNVRGLQPVCESHTEEASRQGILKFRYLIQSLIEENRRRALRLEVVVLFMKLWVDICPGNERSVEALSFSLPDKLFVLLTN